jgi:hypothetical protein
MTTPPTFTIESRSNMNEPVAIYNFESAHTYRNDIIRWEADGQTHVARVCETHKPGVGMTYVYGYIKTWDKRGRLIRKGKQRRLIGIPSEKLVDYIGYFAI